MQLPTRISRLVAIILISPIFILTAFASQESDLQYTLGVQQLAAENYREAQRSFEKVIKLEPRRAQARYLLAYTLEKRNEDTAALAILESLLADEPKNASALQLTGIIQLKLNRAGAAKASLQRSLAIAPNDANTVYYKGLAEQADGAYADSIKSFKQSMQLDPRLKAAALYFSGLSFLKLNDEPHAIEHLEAVRHEAPQSGYAVKAAEVLERLEAQSDAGPQGWAFNSGIGIQYDSNVILEPDTIEISDEDDFRGIGTLGLGYTAGPWNIAYGFYQSLHIELTDFNVQNHRLGFDYLNKSNYLAKPLTTGVRGYSALTLLSNSLAYFSIENALEPYLLRQWSDAYTFGATLRLQYEDFRSVDDLRDNLGYGLILSHLIGTFNNQFFIGIRTGLQLEDASREYDLFRFNGDLQLALPLGRTQLTAQGGYEKSLFAHSTLNREDNKLSAGAGASYAFWGPLSAAAAYQYTSSDSNVAAFNYARHIVSFSINGNY